MDELREFKSHAVRLQYHVVFIPGESHLNFWIETGAVLRFD